MTLEPRKVHDRLASRFPDAGLAYVDGRIPSTVVPLERLLDVARCLRDDPGLRFDYPASFTAVDYLDRFELIYQVRSLVLGHDAMLRIDVDREEPRAPSLVSVWPGADFQEREIYDMFGIVFVDHPNLTRILLWEDFEGYPLRKDYGIPAPLPPEVELALRGEAADPSPASNTP